jgi:hypothetical protein
MHAYACGEEINDVPRIRTPYHFVTCLLVIAFFVHFHMSHIVVKPNLAVGIMTIYLLFDSL